MQNERTGEGLPRAEPGLPQNEKLFVAGWAEGYPTGIPRDYQLVCDTSGRHTQFYIEGYLPTEFYNNPPQDIKAMFSTEEGNLGARKVSNPERERQMRLWDAQTIQTIANSIRRKYWHLMRGMQKPEQWTDVIKYFDAHDIYMYGALNLWNVVTHLWHENDNLSRDLAARMQLEAGRWADEWLTSEGNRQKLLQFTSGDILALVPAEDKGKLPDNRQSDWDLARSALTYRLGLLRSNSWKAPKNLDQSKLETFWKNGQVHHWLGKTKQGVS